MVDRIELLETWMKERKMTKSMLSREINIPVSTVCTAMNPKNVNCYTRYGTFWNNVAVLTGDKSYEVKFKINKNINHKVDIPEYVENLLKVYGKTVVNKQLLKKYGEKGLIDFAGKGIKCKIKIEYDETNEPYHYLIVI